jgi:salicylate hydroxylase
MPYMAQGAAQATEDAATLQAALRQFDNLGDAFHSYQNQRLPRTTHIARHTRVLQAWWHLYDGPGREQRDELMKHDNLDNPMFWGSSQRLIWLFGHDATKIVDRVEKLRPPRMPGMPHDEDLVYNIKDSELRKKFHALRKWQH